MPTAPDTTAESDAQWFRDHWTESERWRDAAPAEIGELAVAGVLIRPGRKLQIRVVNIGIGFHVRSWLVDGVVVHTSVLPR